MLETGKDKEGIWMERRYSLNRMNYEILIPPFCFGNENEINLIFHKENESERRRKLLYNKDIVN